MSGIKKEISEIVFLEIFKRCEEGYPMVSLVELMKKIQIHFKQQLKITANYLEEILFPGAVEKNFILTTRSFGEKAPEKFVSFQMTEISLQNIFIILKSIAND